MPKLEFLGYRLLYGGGDIAIWFKPILPMMFKSCSKATRAFH